MFDPVDTKLASVPEEHGETFIDPRMPVDEYLTDERIENSREVLFAKQTDHAMLQSLPAPGARSAQATVYTLERRFGDSYDNVLDGNKLVFDNAAQIDPLQDMLTYDQYNVNTFRPPAEPWDERLIG